MERLKENTDNHEKPVESNILQPDEIARLLEAADSRWRILIMTAMLTGLRQGELLGLQWGDVDWTAQQILVHRTYTHGRFYDPKTRTSRRRVDLPTALLLEQQDEPFDPLAGMVQL